MEFEPEEVDLEDLVEKLDLVFGQVPPVGYLTGRTAIRDAVAAELGCSQLQAEEVVDTMVERGFLRYLGPTANGVDELEPWRFVSDAYPRGGSDDETEINERPV
jgi:hypothetical protein